MARYYSPDGNVEIWDEKPDNYLTPAEWAAAHPAPEVSIEELKERKRTEILAARDAAIAAGTFWRTHPIDTDEDAQRAASAQIVKSMAYQQMGKAVPDTPWRLKNGSYIMLTDADIWDLSQTIETYVSGCYAKEAAFMEQITAAQTPNEIRKISWTD